MDQPVSSARPRWELCTEPRTTRPYRGLILTWTSAKSQQLPRTRTSAKQHRHLLPVKSAPPPRNGLTASRADDLLPGKAEQKPTSASALDLCVIPGQTPFAPRAVCAPSRIRTCDLLLRRHFRHVAERCWVGPDIPFSCTDSGWEWPGVAQHLSLLAPHDLVSLANVRMLCPPWISSATTGT